MTGGTPESALPDLLISVVICTRNRASSLQCVLESLAACAAKGGDDWEVLVVDNNSTDATAEVLRPLMSRLPLRYTFEPVDGLSSARNRGVAEARGHWLLWLDDDCVVGPGYLRAYRESIACHPQADLLGGPIQAKLEGHPPDWLVTGMHWIADAYAQRNPERDDAIDRATLPYGANFALRRKAALTVPFDPLLGRHPERPLAGEEELDVMRALLSTGRTGYWVTGAVVQHCIDPHRQSLRYLYTYFKTAGEVAARRDLAGRRWQARCFAFLKATVVATRHALEFCAGTLNLWRWRRARNLQQLAWQSGYARACLTFLLNRSAHQQGGL